MPCRCFIIPNDVLERLSHDKKLAQEERDNFENTAAIDAQMRKVREQAVKLSRLTATLSLAPSAGFTAPAITLADCAHGTGLPGAPVPNPGTSTDQTVKRAFAETTKVAEFYKTIFGRNSVDNAGLTLGSSVHYGVNYNNAFWNGTRMVYGDGDGNIFVDFTKGNDVICHELTHGVTQYSLQLGYTNQAGGLNESASDVFGSMYRQWSAGQTVAKADWLIGKDIMGPGAKARGYTCLRDMASPGAKHCLAPQPFHFKDYKNGMDPHYASGIPNFAFYKIAKQYGGKSWEKVGQVWYKALTGSGAQPSMSMKTYANKTRALAASMYPGDAALVKAFNDGWTAVGL